MSNCDICGKSMVNKNGKPYIGLGIQVYPEIEPIFSEFVEIFGKSQLNSCYICLAKNAGFKAINDVQIR